MRTPLLCIVFLAGCFQVPLDSNDPDSGSSCPTSAVAAGNATLQGSATFGVGAAYQSASQTIVPDAGGVSGAQLHVELLRDPVSCAQRQDAGPGEGFFASVADVNADRIGTGRYATLAESDGGAWLYGFVVLDGGVLTVASGSLQLTALTDCSAAA